jgi:chemotaxis response regulator CheB
VARILVVYRNPLFAHSLRSVLANKPEHRLVGEVDDWDRVKNQLQKLAPDTVIVEAGEGGSVEAVLETMKAGSAAWQVIAMQLDQPTMRIWSGSSLPIQQSQDLLDALTSAKPARPRRRARPKKERKS